MKAAYVAELERNNKQPTGTREIDDHYQFALTLEDQYSKYSLKNHLRCLLLSIWTYVKRGMHVERRIWIAFFIRLPNLSLSLVTIERTGLVSIAFLLGGMVVIYISTGSAYLPTFRRVLVLVFERMNHSIQLTDSFRFLILSQLFSLHDCQYDIFNSYFLFSDWLIKVDKSDR